MAESPLTESFIAQHLSHFIKKRSGNAGFILCPFHGDNDPSMRVLIKSENGYPAGSFHCFGCGAHGSYNKLAERLGIPTLNPVALLEEQPRLAKEKLASASKPVMGFIPVPDQEIIPDSFTWRGLSGSFLRAWGCVIAPDPMYWLNNNENSLPLGFQRDIKRLYIFSQYRGNYAGWVAYRISGNLEPKVFNMPGMWSSRHFLPNVIGMTDRVALVEGPYDALRLMYNGIPAMCTLGVQSWNDRKADKIISAMFKKVLIMGDGDSAGYDFNQRVYQSLSPYGIGDIFALPRSETVLEDGAQKKLDPGNMPMRFIDVAKRALFS